MLKVVSVVGECTGLGRANPTPPGAEPWKTFSLIATATATAAALLAFAAPAAALEATYVYPQTLVVGKTRAEVNAELAVARADGTLVVFEARYSVGDRRRALRHSPAAAVTVTAQTAKADTSIQRVRSELSTSSYELQSFDGVVTSAGGAIGARATRVN